MNRLLISRVSGSAVLACALGVLALSAQAAPVAVGETAFSGAQLVDFNALPDRFTVSSPFPGVSVGTGPLVTNSSAAVLAAFGSQGASSFDYGDTSIAGRSITLLFDQPIVRLGLLQFSSSTDFLISVLDEQLLFASGASPLFAGVEDLGGFTEATLFVASENAAFSIDDLRFQFADTPGNTVPEPGALALATLALGAAGWAGRRGRQRGPR